MSKARHDTAPTKSLMRQGGLKYKERAPPRPREKEATKRDKEANKKKVKKSSLDAALRVRGVTALYAYQKFYLCICAYVPIYAYVL